MSTFIIINAIFVPNAIATAINTAETSGEKMFLKHEIYRYLKIMHIHKLNLP